MGPIKSCLSPIRHVLIYKGHVKNPLLGPFPGNVIKRINTFNELNRYREEYHQPLWKVSAVAGEDLINTLKNENPKEALLVIPAGQSTTLDKVFSIAQTSFIKDTFLANGGRGYFNCGSAYWVSTKRIYNDLCEEQTQFRKPIIKTTNLPLFDGIAEGPLCPFPGKKYKAGFFSDAVKVVDENKHECTIYLSGGGSFIPSENSKTNQKIKVLVRYPHSELRRLGKKIEECQKWENAAVLASVGQGAVLLSMFHPYYGPDDFNIETYEKMFPDCGTNWRAVKEKLSPLDIRMRFVLNGMLSELEAMNFE